MKYIAKQKETILNFKKYSEDKNKAVEQPTQQAQFIYRPKVKQPHPDQNGDGGMNQSES